MNMNAATAAVQANGNYRMAVLDEHRKAVAVLAAAKAREAELRAEVIALFSERTEALASGMENIETGYGTLKIEHKLNYELAKDNDAVDAMLDKLEKSQEGGNVIAERLVSWKPEISVREYKLLTAAQKALVDAVLTIKPAAKSVKLEPVKG